MKALLKQGLFSFLRRLNQRFRPSAGGEISVKWRELILFRIDVGVSNEGVLTYVEGRHLF